jgi:thiosulfate sulfurtransferase
MNKLEFQRMPVEEAKCLIDNPNLIILDTRDSQSYQAGHVPRARNFHEPDFINFCRDTNKNKMILVYCYKGFSCQAVAQRLAEQGFSKVYSMDGGFTGWAEQND